LRLKHQVGLLLALPLAFQLAFAGVPIWLLISLQEAGEKESRAKEIVIACQDMRDQMFGFIILLSAKRYTDQLAAKELREHMETKVQAELKRMDRLTKGDAWSKDLLNRYSADLQNFVSLLRDYTDTYRGGGKLQISRFIRESEYLEEIFDSWLHCQSDEKDIIAHYKPRADALQPKAKQTRESILAVLVAALIFNTALVIALGRLFGKHTVARLQQLMQHINEFGLGKLNTVPVGGSDEVAELDEKFRQIAQAKIESDELRRAMYGMVSHDLRSPLTSIGLTLDMIKQNKEANIDSDSRHSISRAAAEVQRLIRLASSFLDGQKLETGQLQLNIRLVSADELTEPAISAVMATAEIQNISITSNISEDPASYIELECDRDRVIQVLVNLLSNAVKFSPPNSQVQLNVSKFTKPGETIERVRFDVVDEAAKFSEQDRAVMFQAFSKTTIGEGTLQQVGTGLGLYLCKLIVQSHAGTIDTCEIDEKHKSIWFEIPQPKTIP
jgi:signal transduction histidine kinase